MHHLQPHGTQRTAWDNQVDNVRGQARNRLGAPFSSSCSSPSSHSSASSTTAFFFLPSQSIVIIIIINIIGFVVGQCRHQQMVQIRGDYESIVMIQQVPSMTIVVVVVVDDDFGFSSTRKPSSSSSSSSLVRVFSLLFVDRVAATRALWSSRIRARYSQDHTGRSIDRSIVEGRNGCKE
jgi:hypothetical protein